MTSRFVYGDDRKIEEIKKLYRDARCKAAHEYRNGTHDLYEKSQELLYNLLLKCIDEEETLDIKSIMLNAQY